MKATGENSHYSISDCFIHHLTFIHLLIITGKYHCCVTVVKDKKWTTWAHN